MWFEPESINQSTVAVSLIGKSGEREGGKRWERLKIQWVSSIGSRPGRDAAD